jgi:hypothetical protein
MACLLLHARRWPEVCNSHTSAENNRCCRITPSRGGSAPACANDTKRTCVLVRPGLLTQPHHQRNYYACSSFDGITNGLLSYAVAAAQSQSPTSRCLPSCHASCNPLAAAALSTRPSEEQQPPHLDQA